MSSKYLSIHECNSHMKTSENVINKDGTVIVEKDTIIDNNIIIRLNLNNISFINVDYITDDSINEVNHIKATNNHVNDIVCLSDTAKNKCTFVHDYFYSIGTIKKIMNSIRNNDEFDTSILLKLGEYILNCIVINSPQDIINCIMKVQSPEEYTYIHCVNVSLISSLIGKWLNFPNDKLGELAITGLLHDVGKTKIPFEVINKPSKLTPEEFEEIKKHSFYGAEIVRTIGGFSRDIFDGILMHHERENGTGYPNGIKGNSIHIFAKILAIADIFSAMTSNKAYKGSVLPFKALSHFKQQQFQELDLDILNLFIVNFSNCYCGKLVILNTGTKGIVETINIDNLERPVISINSGSLNNYIDLSTEPSLEIVNII